MTIHTPNMRRTDTVQHTHVIGFEFSSSFEMPFLKNVIDMGTFPTGWHSCFYLQLLYETSSILDSWYLVFKHTVSTTNNPPFPKSYIAWEIENTHTFREYHPLNGLKIRTKAIRIWHGQKPRKHIFGVLSVGWGKDRC